MPAELLTFNPITQGSHFSDLLNRACPNSSSHRRVASLSAVVAGIQHLSFGFVKKKIHKMYKCTVLALVFLVHKIYKKHETMLSFYYSNDRTAEQPQSP